MPRDFIYRGCKEAERAFKRSQFDPSTQKPEEFPWFSIKPGEEFHIPLDKLNHRQARNAATNRSRKSGYVYRVSKRIDGTLVHRTARLRSRPVLSPVVPESRSPTTTTTIYTRDIDIETIGGLCVTYTIDRY